MPGPNQPNAPPPNQPPGPPGPPSVRQKPASMATYKRELRKEIRRNASESEVNFLNITAMMDMMTIILVFLLKSMTSSTSPPQSTDLMLPKSVLTTEAAQEGLAILVSKTHIVVEDSPICPVPPDATHGVEGRYKKNGSTNDLYITPLATAAQSWRDRDVMIRAAMGKDTSSSEAIIIADANTPFRLLIEVIFTLGQTSFAKYHLMVMQGQKK
jgi:biopolymer transport protein ExbD